MFARHQDMCLLNKLLRKAKASVILHDVDPLEQRLHAVSKENTLAPPVDNAAFVHDLTVPWLILKPTYSTC